MLISKICITEFGTEKEKKPLNKKIGYTTSIHCDLSGGHFTDRFFKHFLFFTRQLLCIQRLSK